jgi:hypothetical protein
MNLKYDLKNLGAHDKILSAYSVLAVVVRRDSKDRMHHFQSNRRNRVP